MSEQPIDELVLLAFALACLVIAAALAMIFFSFGGAVAFAALFVGGFIGYLVGASVR